MDISDLSSDKDRKDPPLYDSEISQGIYNLVVALCSNKAMSMPLSQAKLEVASMLEDLAGGLRSTITTQQDTQGDSNVN